MLVAKTSQKRGRPTGSVRYSFRKILTGSDLSRRRLAVMQADSGQAGPVVWLTGCVHGDEVGGIVVIQEIFKRLRETRLQRGRLCAFPLMNPMGFELSARHVAVSGGKVQQRVIATRAGHLITLDDTDGGGGITIQDKSGNTIALDSGGNKLTISIKGDATLTAQGNLDLEAQGNLTLKAQSQLQIQGMSVSMQGSANVDIKGTPINLN